MGLTCITLIALVIFALIGRTLYGKSDPRRFGNLASAAFFLFGLMTLDNWYDYVNDSQDTGGGSIFAFLMVYIIIETFIFVK